MAIVSMLYGAGGEGTDVSDTTAIESDVAEGKIFHLADGLSVVGTKKIFFMSNRGSVSAHISLGFKPKRFVYVCKYSNNNPMVFEYDADINPTQYYIKFGTNFKYENLGNDQLDVLDNDGINLFYPQYHSNVTLYAEN